MHDPGPISPDWTGEQVFIGGHWPPTHIIKPLPGSRMSRYDVNCRAGVHLGRVLPYTTVGFFTDRPTQPACYKPGWQVLTVAVLAGRELMHRQQQRLNDHSFAMVMGHKISCHMIQQPRCIRSEMWQRQLALHAVESINFISPGLKLQPVSRSRLQAQKQDRMRHVPAEPSSCGASFIIQTTHNSTAQIGINNST